MSSASSEERTIIRPVSYKATPVSTPQRLTAAGQQQLADIPATARQLPTVT